MQGAAAATSIIIFLTVLAGTDGKKSVLQDFTECIYPIRKCIIEKERNENVTSVFPKIFFDSFSKLDVQRRIAPWLGKSDAVIIYAQVCLAQRDIGKMVATRGGILGERGYDVDSIPKEMRDLFKVNTMTSYTDCFKNLDECIDTQQLREGVRTWDGCFKERKVADWFDEYQLLVHCVGNVIPKRCGNADIELTGSGSRFLVSLPTIWMSLAGVLLYAKSL